MINLNLICYWCLTIYSLIYGVGVGGVAVCIKKNLTSEKDCAGKEKSVGNLIHRG